MSVPAPERQRLEREYDALAYPGAPLLKSHPDQLAVLGRLFGVRAAPVEACRVLELGCGEGANLLPMAAAAPGSVFVGVDISEAHLARGRRVAEALGLGNVTLLHADLMSPALDAMTEPFDYILCHGVLSWVATPVQERILALMGRLLAPTGIAYLSFNAYPGWHLLGMLRGMLLRGDDLTAPPVERVRRARQTLARLEASSGLPHNEVGAALRPELERLRGTSDGYLFHEYLTEHNEAFWLGDIVSRAERRGLTWLANAVPETMVAANFGPAALAAVAGVDDPVAAQERLDVALGRPFNSILLCRREQPIVRTPIGDVLDELFVDAWIDPDPSVGDLDDGALVTVTASTGVVVQVEGADLRAALGALSRVRPSAVAFGELWRQVLAQVGARGDAEARRRDLAGRLLVLYFSAVVGLSTRLPEMTHEVSARPLASPLARLQATEQTWVTNQWHQKVPLPDRERALLARLDGRWTPPAADAEALRELAWCGLLVS